MMRGDQLIEHLPGLRAYALHLTRRSWDADDLVQSTVLRALEKAHLFVDDENLGGWLSHIMHNTNVDRLRSLSKRAGKEEAGWLRMGHVPSGDAYASVLLNEVTRAMRRMPEHARDALASYAAGMTYGDMAEQEGIALGTVRSRLNRGRAMLREMTQ
jgi:RNA polymerase sigma-70 factor (ECF subfamily)